MKNLIVNLLTIGVKGKNKVSVHLIKGKCNTNRLKDYKMIFIHGKYMLIIK